tara:strand:- start:69 stop:275 length:207 start_codon:yes stop_codon:yes gene_type:complete
MKDYPIEIKPLSDGDTKVFGNRIFIVDATFKLRDLGYDVGNTISDFRESSLYTNAPAEIINNVINEVI